MSKKKTEKPIIIRKSVKVDDDDLLLMDTPPATLPVAVEPLIAVKESLSLESLLERIRLLEDKTCRMDLYARNLSSQIMNLRQTQDSAFTKLKHSGILRVYDKASAT